MKRLTLLTILLVVVGLTAGALEVKPAFTLSGSGLLEWGLNLDNMGTGFKNTATADLVVTLMAADGTDTHAGKDGWYGSITLSNVEAWLDAPGGVVIPTPDVAAKIVGMGGALVIGIVSAPDLAVDFVPAVEATADSVVEAEAELGTDYNGNGTYLSYTLSDALMFGFEVVSNTDWTVATSDAYAMALDVTAKFAPLTINAGVNYGFADFGEIVGFGVKVAADTAMIDPWVAFDGAYTTALAWEIGAGAVVTLMETVKTTVAALFDSADNFDIMLKFEEPAAKGLVDNLDATLTVYLLDLISALEYEVILAGGYKAGVLYPHFSVTYGLPNPGVALLKAMVGVAIDPLLPLTKLEIHWTSGDLLGTPAVMGTLVAGVTVTY